MQKEVKSIKKAVELLDELGDKLNILQYNPDRTEARERALEIMASPELVQYDTESLIKTLILAIHKDAWYSAGMMKNEIGSRIISPK